MIRYDYSTGENLTLPAEFHEDGSITARSIITSIGVFSYRQPDGSIRKEFRSPEEVFSKETLDTMDNLPIYVGHKLGEDGKFEKRADKREEWSVGTASNPIGNNVYVADNIKIVKEDGRAAVKSGIRSFSVGYDCDIRKKPGVWGGIAYDVEQYNIRADHLSLVPAGRQGDQAVLRMDSAEMVIGDTTAVAVQNKDTNEEEGMAENMKTIQLDSVDYQAEPAVIDAYKSEKARADSLVEDVESKQTTISALEAERDSAKEKLDAAMTKITDMEKAHLDEAEITKRVNARIDLMALATDVKAEVKADMSDLDIKKAILVAKNPKLSLDGKDEMYINVRIDCLKEDLAVEKDKNALANVQSVNAPGGRVDSADSADAAEKRYRERLAKQGRK
jgi:uncharacterized protein